MTTSRPAGDDTGRTIDVILTQVAVRAVASVVASGAAPAGSGSRTGARSSLLARTLYLTHLVRVCAFWLPCSSSPMAFSSLGSHTPPTFTGLDWVRSMPSDVTPLPRSVAGLMACVTAKVFWSKSIHQVRDICGEAKNTRGSSTCTRHTGLPAMLPALTGPKMIPSQLSEKGRSSEKMWLEIVRRTMCDGEGPLVRPSFDQRPAAGAVIACDGPCLGHLEATRDRSWRRT